MILIETWEDTNQLEVRASGHANSAPKGQDLVCCAVSVLTQSLALNTKTNIYDYDGDMDITMDNDWHNATLFNAYLASMRVLANQYPDYITLKEA